MVGEESHRKYHQLFQERTPDEIIKYLAEYFWAGQWGWVEVALNDHYARESTKEVRNEVGGD